MASKRGEQDTPGNDEVMKGISDLQRRLRVLEERYTTLRRKGQLIDENFLDTERDLRGKVKRLDEEHTEVRRMLVDLDDKLDRFLEQAKRAAPREDVLVLKKYLEMWDPVQYLTRQEAQRLLDRAQQERNDDQPVANKQAKASRTSEPRSEVYDVSEEPEITHSQKRKEPSPPRTEVEEDDTKEVPKKDSEAKDTKQLPHKNEDADYTTVDAKKDDDIDLSEDSTEQQVTAFLKKQQDKKKAAQKKSDDEEITEEQVREFLKQQQDKKKAAKKNPKE